MYLHLDKKIIIVTNGVKEVTGGIVKILAKEDAIPVIIGRNEEDNLEALERIDNKGFQLVTELNNPEECRKAVKKVVEKYECIDGLVNNGGMNNGVGLENGNYEQFVASLHKDLVHYYLIAHHALPYLKKSKGAIVNIGSKTAETGQGNTSAYAASNGGRNALTREWAVELLKYGIRVNEVVVTEGYTSLYEKRFLAYEKPEEKLRSAPGEISLEKSRVTEEEIAKVVAFLLSERSSHTTGQLIHLNGEYAHLDRAL